MSDSMLHDLLERMNIVLRREQRQTALRFGLQPVHLEVLHYLSRCNRFSDTAVSVSEYLGLTRGTVSQTLALLENRGHIERQVDEDDRRCVHLRLTGRGNRLLQQAIPADAFLDAALHLPAARVEALQGHLKALLRAFLQRRAEPAFGNCPGCRHLEQGTDFFCTRFEVTLQRSELARICRAHEAKETP